jgi:ClpP class serine protease
MTTYYHCDFQNDSTLTKEENEEIRKQHIKEHKETYRLFRQIIGKPLSESEDEDVTIEEIKTSEVTDEDLILLHSKTEDDKQHLLTESTTENPDI